MKQLSIYFSLIQMSIKAKCQYPVAFIVEIVTTILMFFAEFSMIYLFALKIGTIQGWSPQELSFVYSITILAGAIELCFMNGLRGFSNQLVSGDFDTKIIRPIHPLLFILGDLYVGAIAIVLLSVVIVGAVFVTSPEYFTLFNVLWVFISALGGSLIFCSLNLVSAAIAFWTFDSDSFYRLTKNGTRQLLWYPISIYGKVIQGVLTFILPLAFVGYLPAHVITDKTPTYLPTLISYLGLPVGGLCFVVSLWFWHKGLKHYEGAGA